MKLPTFSALARAIACPSSVVLPQEPESTAASHRGGVIHRYLERVPQIGRDRALVEIPEEHRPACEAIDLAPLPVDPQAYAAEVAFALDAYTGEARVLGHGLERDYSDRRPTEFAGTADVIGVGAHAAYAADYKSGWSSLPPARRHAQLRALGLAAARAYGKDAAIVELIRIRDDGTAWVDRAELDAMDLDIVQDELRDLAERIRTVYIVTPIAELPVSLGPWCGHCPAISSCPATRRAVEVALTTDVDVAISDERLAQAFLQLGLLDAWLERAKKRLRTALDWQGTDRIALPDGRVLARVAKPRETVDGPTARAVVQDVAPDLAGDVVELKVTSSKEKVKDVARTLASRAAAAGRKETLKAITDRLLGEIARRGGLKDHGYEKWEPLQPEDKRLVKGDAE